jgi:glucose/arabinose dehydrogenase
MRGRRNTGEMRTADYYRKQTQVFARMASSATDMESANRYRAFAFDYLAKAEKLEPSTGVVVALSNHNDHRDAVSVADGRLIEGIGASFDVPTHDVQMAQAGLAALSR